MPAQSLPAGRLPALSFALLAALVIATAVRTHKDTTAVGIDRSLVVETMALGDAPMALMQARGRAEPVTPEPVTPEQAEDLGRSLLRHADAVMYVGKQGGKHSVRRFTTTPALA